MNSVIRFFRIPRYSKARIRYFYLLIKRSELGRKVGIDYLRMGLATALPYVAPLNACPVCLPQGSDGEAEARIPLKINIYYPRNLPLPRECCSVETQMTGHAAAFFM
jgi:hypothetical protein